MVTRDNSFRRWRKQMGFTQQQAAVALGYSTSRIYIYDTGSQLPPHVVELAMRYLALDIQQKDAA